jgi:hypothetical protein
LLKYLQDGLSGIYNGDILAPPPPPQDASLMITDILNICWIISIVYPFDSSRYNSCKEIEELDALCLLIIRDYPSEASGSLNWKLN